MDPIERLQDRVRQLPTRSLPPPSGATDVSIALPGVDFRLRKSAVPGWAWVPILAVFSAVGTGVVTYYETLRAAGSRVAALEESVRLQSEKISRLQVQLEAANSALDHAYLINRAQDQRLEALGAALVVKVEK